MPHGTVPAIPAPLHIPRLPAPRCNCSGRTFTRSPIMQILHPPDSITIPDAPGPGSDDGALIVRLDRPILMDICRAFSRITECMAVLLYYPRAADLTCRRRALAVLSACSRRALGTLSTSAGCAGQSRCRICCQCRILQPEGVTLQPTTPGCNRPRPCSRRPPTRRRHAPGSGYVRSVSGCVCPGRIGSMSAVWAVCPGCWALFRADRTSQMPFRVQSWKLCLLFSLPPPPSLSPYQAMQDLQ